LTWENYKLVHIYYIILVIYKIITTSGLIINVILNFPSTYEYMRIKIMRYFAFLSNNFIKLKFKMYIYIYTDLLRTQIPLRLSKSFPYNLNIYFILYLFYIAFNNVTERLEMIAPFKRVSIISIVFKDIRKI